ncbi:hypothetical protein B0H21DRAFT_471675 [Amylocystis lapponica]|nr:hypothetical protein B0H21DRAFT_471675 [Amylocystis lapponica]
MPTQHKHIGNQRSAGTGVTDGQQRSAQTNRSSRTHGHHQRSHQAGSTGAGAHSQPEHPAPSQFSEDSSPAVPNSAWYASDFLVGAGMVILQPSTGCIVLLRDLATHCWFLPKGRKDVGESLEQTALREAYEESGFQVQFLPLYTPTNAPLSPQDRLYPWVLPNTEPIYISAMSWRPRRPRADHTVRPGDSGGEYLTFWYVGQIAEDVRPRLDANMPDEERYITHLMPIKDAVRVLREDHEDELLRIVIMAWNLLVERVNSDRARERELVRHREAAARAASSTTDSVSPSASSTHDESPLAGQDFPASDDPL